MDINKKYLIDLSCVWNTEGLRLTPSACEDAFKHGFINKEQSSALLIWQHKTSVFFVFCFFCIFTPNKQTLSFRAGAVYLEQSMLCVIFCSFTTSLSAQQHITKCQIHTFLITNWCGNCLTWYLAADEGRLSLWLPQLFLHTNSTRRLLKGGKASGKAGLCLPKDVS